MKSLIMGFILAAYPAVSFATVEFIGGGWYYGTAVQEVVETVGVATEADGIKQVVLNLRDKRQVKFMGGHTALGLSLMALKGSCIKIIPGYRFESVNIITSCD